MKKRGLMLIMVLAAALLLSACSGSGNTQSGSAAKDEYAYVLNSTGEWIRLVRYLGEESEITVPDTLNGKPVKEICANTFAFSPQITSIAIPASVNKIEDPSFSCLPNLQHITVAEDNVGFAAVDDVLFHKKMKTVYCYPQGKEGAEYALPDTITTIGARAFYCSKLEKVILPDTVNKIQTSAFEGSGNLTSVNLPPKLSQIFESAFADCVKLQDIVFPDSLTSIAAGSFRNCAGLTELVIPEKVGVVDAGAFEGCAALKTVVFNTSSIQRVSDRTFKNCSSLVSVQYVADLLGIGNEAFYGCLALETVPSLEKLTTLGQSAFRGCGKLSVTLPDTLMDIGARALEGTPALEALEGDFAVTGGGVVLSYRGESRDVTVPDGAVRISCLRQDITSVSVPESVTALCGGAFENCTALASVTLPDTLLSIGPNAFAYCTALEFFTVPAGTASIGDGCFTGCTGMKAFDVKSGNTTYMVDRGVLYDNSKKLLIWYPSASEMTSYAVPYGPVGVGDHGIENAVNLESCDLSAADGIVSVGDYVFANCPKLRSVKVNESFSRFGAHAFENCPALSDLKLTATMTIFGEYAFKDCTSFGDQSLSANVARIEKGAFENTNGTYSVFSMTLGEEYMKTWQLRHTVR